MKKYLLVTGIFCLLGIGTAFLVYNKPHKNILKAQPDFTLSSQELFESFERDENAANKIYLDKVVQITGVITETSLNDDGSISVTLDGGNMIFGTICKMDIHSKHKRNSFQEGECVTLRGICSGMLMDVVLVRCIEI